MSIWFFDFSKNFFAAVGGLVLKLFFDRYVSWELSVLQFPKGSLVE